MQIDSSTKPAENPQNGEFELEDNLIFARSDSISVFSIQGSKGQEQLSLRCEYSLNDQIVDMLVIPTD